MKTNQYQPKTRTIKANGQTYHLSGHTHGNGILIKTGTGHSLQYYELVTQSNTRTTQPDYGIWNYDQAADLAAVDKNFLGRRMNYKDDPAANYEGINYMMKRYYPEAVILAAANLAVLNHNSKIAHARKCHSHPLYKALEPIAKETIKNYFNDFSYHDARIFAMNPTKIIWQVDENGTWTTTDLADLDQQIQHKTKPAYFIEWNPNRPYEPPQITRLETLQQFTQAKAEIHQAYTRRQQANS